MALDRARVGIRTPNLLIRSQMLYPIELRMQFFQGRKGWEQPRKGCKGTNKIVLMQKNIKIIVSDRPAQRIVPSNSLDQYPINSW